MKHLDPKPAHVEGLKITFNGLFPLKMFFFFLSNIKINLGPVQKGATNKQTQPYRNSQSETFLSETSLLN